MKIHVNFTENGIPMELDIFLPSIGLAMEFHGPQHFKSHFFGSGQLETQEKVLHKFLLRT